MLFTEPSLCTKFEVALVLTAVKISRGSQNVWDAPVTNTPINLGPESCFWRAIHYSSNPSCVPNLKSQTLHGLQPGGYIAE